MKTLRKSLIAVAVTAMVLPAFQSCKKGEEDPGISLKSRDSRITGVWTLKSEEYSWQKESTTTETNSVNSDKTVTDKTEWSTRSYDGSELVEVGGPWGEAYDEKVVTTYDADNSIDDDETTYDGDKNTTTKDYTVKVEIYKDNTYKVTETASVTEIEYCDKDSDGNETCDKPSLQDNNDDVSYEGEWYWLDSKKNKIYISAGPLEGKLLRLSNKDLIIEETSNGSDNTTDVFESTFNDYNDPVDWDNDGTPEYYNTKEGTGTKQVTATTVTTYKATWEKTEKKAEKADSGSDEE